MDTPSLEKLPLELVERIAECVVCLDTQAPDPPALCSLRLASKTLEAKTHRTFLHAYFKHRAVDFSLQGLARLQEISECPVVNATVETLSLGRHLLMSDFDRFHLQLEAQDDNVALQDQVRALDRDASDRRAFETGGMGTLLLSKALENLINVSKITLDPSNSVALNIFYSTDRHCSRGPGSCATLFASIFSAMWLAKHRVESLVMPYDNLSLKADGIGMVLDQFEFPSPMWSVFDKLTSLSLVCTLSNSTILCDFLLALPALKELSIVCNGWSDHDMADEMILDYLVTKRPKASLRSLRLRGLPFALPLDGKFLQHHTKTLESLTLEHCEMDCNDGAADDAVDDGLEDDDEPDSRGWPDILEDLKTQERLGNLRLHELAQNGQRTYYPNHPMPLFVSLDKITKGEFIGCELVQVSPYTTQVDEWENMTERISELQTDFTVSRRQAKPDGSHGGLTTWSRAEDGAL